MKDTRHLPAALATAAAVACAAGWYMSANTGHEQDFDFCERSGDELTLTYTYGSGDEILLSHKSEGNGDVTVSYRVVSPDGPRTMQAIIRTVNVDGGSGKVFYPDGRELQCDERDPARSTPAP